MEDVRRLRIYSNEHFPAAFRLLDKDAVRSIIELALDMEDNGHHIAGCFSIEFSGQPLWRIEADCCIQQFKDSQLVSFTGLICETLVFSTKENNLIYAFDMLIR